MQSKNVENNNSNRNSRDETINNPLKENLKKDDILNRDENKRREEFSQQESVQRDQEQRKKQNLYEPAYWSSTITSLLNIIFVLKDTLIFGYLSYQHFCYYWTQEWNYLIFIIASKWKH